MAVLSHELRTPLTPVVMAVQTLVRRSDIPEPAKEALEMIRRNVKIESHLIDDLLDLTRVTRGQFEVVAELMDIHAAIAGAIEICESDFRGKDQTLTVALGAETHVISGRLHAFAAGRVESAEEWVEIYAPRRGNSSVDSQRR